MGRRRRSPTDEGRGLGEHRRPHAARVGRDPRGGSSELYFVFAGHGDVDAGVGFLELRDARFTSVDLESMLRTIGATRSHVILDSCNSFFVVNARRPGGRRVATTADEARSLGERLPSVGVFLSTSSEAEVFEWSELQAGIFSHAVRSGLTGAADANGDGEVSYEELRAFVSVATSRINNPLYRPKVFARGPGADERASLVSLGSTHGTALRLDGPQVRLTVRDADDVPLVDLHKENGAVVTVRLPARWAARAVAEQRDPGASAQVLRRFAIEPRPDQPMLAQLSTEPAVDATRTARGANDVFRLLFAVPFGPGSMQAAIDETRREDATAVYGVSEDQVERMRLLVTQAEESGRDRRLTDGVGDLALGAAVAGTGSWLLAKDGSSFEAYSAIASGGVIAGFGVVALATSSSEEDLFGRYSNATRTADPSQRAAAVASAERDLFILRQRAHQKRMLQRGLGFVCAGLGALGLVLGATNTANGSDAAWAERISNGLGIATGGALAISSFVPYPVERLADLWESDPGHVRGDVPSALRALSFAPVRGGGGELRFGGTF